jgi:dienelactone hydrolase
LSEADDATIEAATIPVEQIDGPILLVAAGDDQLWPSPSMTEALTERLRASDFPHTVEATTYESAGHLIYAPYQPTTYYVVNTFVMGGSPPATAAAYGGTWEQILAFLDEHLRTP